MALSRRLRFEVLRRDGHTCRYCGAAAPDVKLTVDHVIPVALGGGDEPNNLVTACQDCNAGKSSTSPDEHIVEDVDAAAMLMAQALRDAEEIRRYDMAEINRGIVAWGEHWEEWKDGYGNPIPRDRDWTTSIERFLSQGLRVAELMDFTFKAMNSQASPDGVWKYFCGCCWKEIGIRHELARQLIEDGEV